MRRINAKLKVNPGVVALMNTSSCGSVHRVKRKRRSCRTCPVATYSVTVQSLLQGARSQARDAQVATSCLASIRRWKRRV